MVQKRSTSKSKDRTRPFIYSGVRREKKRNCILQEGFTKALELNPLDQSTILNIVDVLKAIRRVDDAKDIGSSYLKARPDDVEVREAYATL